MNYQKRPYKLNKCVSANCIKNIPSAVLTGKADLGDN